MKRHLLAAGLVAAAVLAVYSNSLRNGFVGDDHLYVELNPFVQAPSNLRYLVDPRFYLRTSEVLAGNRPLLLASLLADRALWGNRPAGYHATNLLVHAANSAWVYALSVELGLAAPIPLWAGLFFGLHPIQTEAVDAVSFRSDPLAAFFLFFSLWAYLRARRRTSGKAAPWIAASALLFGAALLAKEMAITLPLLALLAEAYFPSPKGRRRRLGLALAAFFLVACAYGGFWSARFAYHGMGAPSPLFSALRRFLSAMPTAPGSGGPPLGLRKGFVTSPSSWEWASLYADRGAWTWTMIEGLAGYFRWLLFPYSLAVDRALPVVGGWNDPGALASLAVLLAIAAYAVRMRRKHPPSAFALAWCLTTLLPVSNVIALFNPIAERYLYLVAAGAAWALASAVSYLAHRPGKGFRRAALVVGGLIACAYGLRTHARNADWQSDAALYLGHDERAPQDSRVRLARGNLLREQGRYAESILEFEEGLRANPNSPEAWLGLAATYGAERDLERAFACYEKAVSLAPDNLILRFSYAQDLARAGRSARAIAQYRRLVEQEPGYLEAWVNLAALYRDTRQYSKSSECYQSAIRLAGPGDATPFFSYGLLLEKMGDIRGARSQYEAALERDPAFAQARQGLERLAR